MSNLSECGFIILLLYRDGLQESNVVTKTFTVDDIGPPDDDVDVDSFFQAEEDVESVFDMAPVIPKRNTRPQPSLAGPVVKKKVGHRCTALLYIP